MKDVIIQNARLFYGLDIHLGHIGWMKAQAARATDHFFALYSILATGHLVAAIRVDGQWVAVIVGTEHRINTVLHRRHLQPFRAMLDARCVLLRNLGREAMHPRSRRVASGEGVER